MQLAYIPAEKRLGVILLENHEGSYIRLLDDETTKYYTLDTYKILNPTTFIPLVSNSDVVIIRFVVKGGNET